LRLQKQLSNSLHVARDTREKLIQQEKDQEALLAAMDDLERELDKQLGSDVRQNERLEFYSPIESVFDDLLTVEKQLREQVQYHNDAARASRNVLGTAEFTIDCQFETIRDLSLKARAILRELDALQDLLAQG
jgi:hypothetical protein